MTLKFGALGTQSRAAAMCFWGKVSVTQLSTGKPLFCVPSCGPVTVSRASRVSLPPARRALQRSSLPPAHFPALSFWQLPPLVPRDGCGIASGDICACNLRTQPRRREGSMLRRWLGVGGDAMRCRQLGWLGREINGCGEGNTAALGL